MARDYDGLGKMAEQRRPISADWAQAFGYAVAQFETWSPPRAEPTMIIGGKPYSISSICNIVERFTDELPKVLLSDLLSLMDDTNMDLKTHLANERSYAAGARCLRKSIADRYKAHMLRGMTD